MQAPAGSERQRTVSRSPERGTTPGIPETALLVRVRDVAFVESHAFFIAFQVAGRPAKRRTEVSGESNNPVFQRNMMFFELVPDDVSGADPLKLQIGAFVVAHVTPGSLPMSPSAKSAGTLFGNAILDVRSLMHDIQGTAPATYAVRLRRHGFSRRRMPSPKPSGPAMTDAYVGSLLVELHIITAAEAAALALSAASTMNSASMSMQSWRTAGTGFASPPRLMAMSSATSMSRMLPAAQHTQEQASSVGSNATASSSDGPASFFSAGKQRALNFTMRDITAGADPDAAQAVANGQKALDAPSIVRTTTSSPPPIAVMERIPEDEASGSGVLSPHSPATSPRGLSAVASPTALTTRAETTDTLVASSASEKNATADTLPTASAGSEAEAAGEDVPPILLPAPACVQLLAEQLDEHSFAGTMASVWQARRAMRGIRDGDGAPMTAWSGTTESPARMLAPQSVLPPSGGVRGTASVGAASMAVPGRAWPFRAVQALRPECLTALGSAWQTGAVHAVKAFVRAGWIRPPPPPEAAQHTPSDVRFRVAVSLLEPAVQAPDGDAPQSGVWAHDATAAEPVLTSPQDRTALCGVAWNDALMVACRARAADDPAASVPHAGHHPCMLRLQVLEERLTVHAPPAGELNLTQASATPAGLPLRAPDNGRATPRTPAQGGHIGVHVSTPANARSSSRTGMNPALSGSRLRVISSKLSHSRARLDISVSTPDTGLRGGGTQESTRLGSTLRRSALQTRDRMPLQGSANVSDPYVPTDEDGGADARVELRVLVSVDLDMSHVQAGETRALRLVWRKTLHDHPEDEGVSAPACVLDVQLDVLANAYAQAVSQWVLNRASERGPLPTLQEASAAMGLGYVCGGLLEDEESNPAALLPSSRTVPAVLALAGTAGPPAALTAVYRGAAVAPFVVHGAPHAMCEVSITAIECVQAAEATSTSRHDPAGFPASPGGTAIDASIRTYVAALLALLTRASGADATADSNDAALLQRADTISSAEWRAAFDALAASGASVTQPVTTSNRRLEIGSAMDDVIKLSTVRVAAVLAAHPVLLHLLGAPARGLDDGVDLARPPHLATELRLACSTGAHDARMEPSITSAHAAGQLPPVIVVDVSTLAQAAEIATMLATDAPGSAPVLDVHAMTTAALAAEERGDVSLFDAQHQWMSPPELVRVTRGFYSAAAEGTTGERAHDESKLLQATSSIWRAASPLLAPALQQSAGSLGGTAPICAIMGSTATLPVYAPITRLPSTRIIPTDGAAAAPPGGRVQLASRYEVRMHVLECPSFPPHDGVLAALADATARVSGAISGPPLVPVFTMPAGRPCGSLRLLLPSVDSNSEAPAGAPIAPAGANAVAKEVRLADAQSPGAASSGSITAVKAIRGVHGVARCWAVKPLQSIASSAHRTGSSWMAAAQTDPYYSSLRATTVAACERNSTITFARAVSLSSSFSRSLLATIPRNVFALWTRVQLRQAPPVAVVVDTSEQAGRRGRPSPRMQPLTPQQRTPRSAAQAAHTAPVQHAAVVVPTSTAPAVASSDARELMSPSPSPPPEKSKSFAATLPPRSKALSPTETPPASRTQPSPPQLQDAPPESVQNVPAPVQQPRAPASNAPPGIAMAPPASVAPASTPASTPSAEPNAAAAAEIAQLKKDVAVRNDALRKCGEEIMQLRRSLKTAREDLAKTVDAHASAEQARAESEDVILRLALQDVSGGDDTKLQPGSNPLDTKVRVSAVQTVKDSRDPVAQVLARRLIVLGQRFIQQRRAATLMAAEVSALKAELAANRQNSGSPSNNAKSDARPAAAGRAPKRGAQEPHMVTGIHAETRAHLSTVSQPHATKFGTTVGPVLHLAPSMGASMSSAHMHSGLPAASRLLPVRLTDAPSDSRTSLHSALNSSLDDSFVSALAAPADGSFMTALAARLHNNDGGADTAFSTALVPARRAASLSPGEDDAIGPYLRAVVSGAIDPTLPVSAITHAKLMDAHARAAARCAALEAEIAGVQTQLAEVLAAAQAQAEHVQTLQSELTRATLLRSVVQTQEALISRYETAMAQLAARVGDRGRDDTSARGRARSGTAGSVHDGMRGGGKQRGADGLPHVLSVRAKADPALALAVDDLRSQYEEALRVAESTLTAKDIRIRVLEQQLAANAADFASRLTATHVRLAQVTTAFSVDAQGSAEPHGDDRRPASTQRPRVSIPGAGYLSGDAASPSTAHTHTHTHTRSRTSGAMPLPSSHAGSLASPGSKRAAHMTQPQPRVQAHAVPGSEDEPFNAHTHTHSHAHAAPDRHRGPPTSPSAALSPAGDGMLATINELLREPVF